jgi:hypothetical protein
VLHIFVHKDVSLSELIVSDILDSDHLPIVFTCWIILELGIFRTRLTNSDWGRFQSLVSELISPRIQINLEEEADKEAHDFIASIASVYRLLTSKITCLELNIDLPILKSLLKQKQRLRKL